jgi:hypothetical protein
MEPAQLKILAVCDEVDRRLYGAAVGTREKPDLILGCGDLPAYYLDFLVSQLNAPLYAVHGNHDAPPGPEAGREFEQCGVNWIGGRAVKHNGVLLAGFDGSLRYNDGAYQSSQGQMQTAVRSLAPWLWLNKLRYGRARTSWSPTRHRSASTTTATYVTPVSRLSAGSWIRSGRATTSTATCIATIAVRRP